MKLGYFSATTVDGATSVISESNGFGVGKSTAQTWTYFNGDASYQSASATLSPRPVASYSAFTLTPSSATGSAPLIGGRLYEMSLSLSYAASLGLQMTPRCYNS